KSYMEVIEAMQYASQGEFDRANTLFQRNQATPGWIGLMARLTPAMAAGDWPQVLMQLQGVDLAHDPFALSNYIGALGETGDLNGMLREFEQYRTILQRTRSLTQTAIYVFAFCGQSEELDKLFQGQFKHFPESIKNFWLATTYLAAGNRAVAES